ncbi:MAG: hypothetical protein IPK68_19605 [Bdellovibrionales bacterium]|nr:hypothetical protein [Bdellovibrionales bacterium]
MGRNGAGKSTLLKHMWSLQSYLWINKSSRENRPVVRIRSRVSPGVVGS